MHVVDLFSQNFVPALCDLGPVGLLRGSFERELVENFLDEPEWNADPLRRADECKAAKHISVEPTLVSLVACTEDESLSLVEMQRRHRDTASFSDLPDRELIG